MVNEIVAIGHHYPPHIVGNDLFVERAQYRVPRLESLARETKMKTRRWCGPGESTWTMARAAVDAAFASAPVQGLQAEIDLIIVSSASTLPHAHAPEPETPSMAELAPLIADHLGRKVLSIDLRAVACTGFLRGLELADAMLATGRYRAALVVASECTSQFATAASNRSGFCYIMGDAAGAAILRPTQRRERVGLRDHCGYIDGSKRGWMSFGDDLASFVVRGAQLGPATIEMMAECGRTLLQRNELSPDEVDWLLPIQTHAGLVEGLCQALAWDPAKLLWQGDVRGFSGSSSIPACLSQQLEQGRVERGASVLALAVGAGLNCAGSLFYV